MSELNEHKLDPYRDTVIDVATKQIMAFLTVEAPWVRLPVINWFVKSLTERVIAYALGETILGVNLLIIKLETDKDVSKFKNSLDEYKKIDPLDVEKKNAKEKDIIDAARSLIALTGKVRL